MHDHGLECGITRAVEGNAGPVPFFPSLVEPQGWAGNFPRHPLGVGVLLNLGDDRGVDGFDAFTVVIDGVATAPDKEEVLVRDGVFYAVQKADRERMKRLGVDELTQAHDNRMIHDTKVC
jgi:hypothetical protein